MARVVLIRVAGRRGKTRVVVLGAMLLVAAMSGATVWTMQRQGPPSMASEETVSNRPIQVADEGYVSSRACRSCHPRQYTSWHASYHRTMTQVVGPDTVVGRFDGVDLQLDGRRYELQRHGHDFWVEIDDPLEPGEADLLLEDDTLSAGAADRPRSVRKPIVMSTGSHHQQAYWIATGDSRKLEALPFVYLIESQRWVPRHSIFLRPAHDRPPMQSGLWNMSCNRCHTTHGRPRLDENENMNTHVAEFGIACEACHGPGYRHVRANRDPRRRYRFHKSNQSDPTIVQPSRLTHRLSSDVCAQCHSVNQFYTEEEEQHWARHGYRFRPGDDLSKTRMLVRYDLQPDEPRLQGILHYNPDYMQDFFWSDGMIRVSGREYNGLQETPCFQRGQLSCLSCHSMHKSPDDSRTLKQWANDQLKPGMDGNQACLQCHESYRDQIQEHTHHPPNSSGSQCYNCHMPHTSYGLLTAMRSHQVDSPSVSTSLETGRPNACNLCHLDKTLEWSAEHLSNWTGQPKPWLTDDERSIAASLLWLLRGDAGQRALIAWSMGWEPARRASGTDWFAPFLAQLLNDPYDAVRYIASRSLRRLPLYADFRYDYVGPRGERAAAQTRAVQMWESSDRGQPSVVRPGVLVESTGFVRRDVLNRLLEQRDDRRVNLNE